MSDIEDDEISNINNSKSIGPGDILSFGSINLLLTLNLEKDDLFKYQVKWDEIKSLENAIFIAKHKHFYKRIELSSKNDTINILLQINKLSKKLIKIAYVGYKKITYKDEQVEFTNMIEAVTRRYGLYITSCEVCKCNISIQLLLKYKNSQKIFVLSGKTTSENDEKKENNKDNSSQNKNDNNNNNANNTNNNNDEENKNNNNDDIKREKENKSEEEDQENPLVNITDDVINPDEFNYIYFNFSDYSSGEFNGRIKIEHLYEYFQTLKYTTKSKIILNLNDEKINNNDEIIKDLLSVTDIFIFYNKNKLYDILKHMKEQEDKTVLKKVYQHHINEAKRKMEEREENKEKEKEFIENYKNFLEKNKTEKEKRINSTLKKEKIKTRPNIYLTQNSLDSQADRISQFITVSENNLEKKNHKTIDIKKIKLKTETSKEEMKDKNITKTKSNSINTKNLKIKLLPIKQAQTKPLNKHEMFDYFKYGICDKDPQKRSQEKIALVLDEFKKIFFIKFNKKDEKPSVLDFDLNLHPQINIRNMKEILESKKFIQSNFSDYSKTFFGSLLSTIVSKGQEGCEEKSLFLAYLVAMNTIKKMVEIQKYDLPMPKNKEFFSPTIKKGEIKRILTEANQRKKERLFVLDGNTKNNIGIKPYNPLLDKNLASFFSTKNNQIFLKLNGFIGKNGEIMYDPLYRDTMQNTNSNYNSIYNKYNNIDSKLIYNSVQRKKNKKPKEDNNHNNHNNLRSIKYKSMTTNKFLFGFRKSPGYSIYNEARKNTLVLPFISAEKRKRKNYLKNKNKKSISEEEIEESRIKTKNEKSLIKSGSN